MHAATALTAARMAAMRHQTLMCREQFTHAAALAAARMAAMWHQTPVRREHFMHANHCLQVTDVFGLNSKLK